MVAASNPAGGIEQVCSDLLVAEQVWSLSHPRPVHGQDNRAEFAGRNRY